MRVLVTGAYGLIGSACLARLHADGHALVALGRPIGVARRRLPYAQWIAANFVHLQDTQAWLPLLNGVDAVVNCVGVLQDGLRDDVRRVQVEATVVLFDACLRAGVRRVVHVSAIGADAEGPSVFARSKAEADAHLQGLALDWVILRPALVLGAGVHGATALLRGLAAFPGVVPMVRADARVQVVSIDDVVETIARSLKPGAPARVLWEVAHPQVHALSEIVTAQRNWLGFAPRRVWRLPDAVGGAVAMAADIAGWLGWRSPLRSTAFAQLSAGVVGEPQSWIADTGIQPKSLEQILAARPANVQDRWFARLYLLKPFAILGLAATAIVAGRVEFGSLWQIANGVLGISVSVFAIDIVPGLIFAAAAVVLGLGLLLRPTTRLALRGLLILTILHAAHYCVISLHLGYLPLTAISAIPILLATLFTLAILDER